MRSKDKKKTICVAIKVDESVSAILKNIDFDS
jgi:hypothetical protein